MFTLFEDKVNDFIKSHTSAVIATVDSEGQPSTSTIFYAVGKKNALHFITKTQTTKFKNLRVNNRAALTILDKDNPIAVNIDGYVTEVTDPTERDTILQELFKLSYGNLQDYAPIIKLHKGTFSALIFTPSRAKMTDFTQPLNKVVENLKEY
jgi:general stress protein 26